MFVYPPYTFLTIISYLISDPYPPSILLDLLYAVLKMQKIQLFPKRHFPTRTSITQIPPSNRIINCISSFILRAISLYLSSAVKQKLRVESFVSLMPSETEKTICGRAGSRRERECFVHPRRDGGV